MTKEEYLLWCDPIVGELDEIPIYYSDVYGLPAHNYEDYLYMMEE